MRKQWMAALAAAALMGGAAQAEPDWPEWRGPQRNGVAKRSPILVGGFAETGPKMLWKTEDIPGHWGGGWGSVSVANNKVYVFANPVKADESEGLIVPEGSMQWWGWDARPLPAKLVAKVEKLCASEELNKLKGEERKAFIEAWIDENLGRRNNKFSNAVTRRLSNGNRALSEAEFRKLDPLQTKVFKDRDEAKAWIKTLGLDERKSGVVERGLKAKKEDSQDRLVCLDAGSGETVWSVTFEGTPSEFRCSPTPTIAKGRVFFLGSGARVYCLDAKTGKELWTAKSKADIRATVSSSFLIHKKLAIVNAGALMAFDIRNGQVVWTQDAVKGVYSSPTLWEKDGRSVLLCHSPNEIHAVDPDSGEVLWSCEGAGGLSTLVVDEDVMVVVGRSRRQGLAAYQIGLDGARRLWKVPFSDRGASASIFDGHVYVMAGTRKGNSRALCVRLDDGEICWDEDIPKTDFSSPVIVDGKALVVTKKALLMLGTDPTEFKILGQAAMEITPCTSPSIAGGKLYLRLNNGIACYDLRTSY